MKFKLLSTERAADLKQLAVNTRRVLALTWSEQRSLFIKVMLVAVVISILPFIRSGAMAILIDELTSHQGVFTQTLALALIFLVLADFLPQTMYVMKGYLDKYMWMRLQESYELMFNKKKGMLDVARHEDPQFNDTMQTASERSIFPILNMNEAQFANVQNIIKVIVAAAILVAFEWYFLIIILLGTLPEFLISLRYGKNMWGIFDAEAEERRRYYAVRDKFFHKSDILELKAFRNVGHFIGIMKDMLVHFNNKQLKEERHKALLSFLGSFVSVVAFGIILTLSVRMVLVGDITIGQMTFLMASIGGFGSAISGFLQSIARQSEMSHFATDIFKVLDAEEIITDPKNPVPIDFTNPPEIVFENVSFHYPGTDTLVLHNTSFTIKPGERIALIGINGAGKTTITKLLARYYDPTSGRILINGIDLRDISRDEWYKYLTILSQDYSNYDSFSISDMIALGNTSTEKNPGQVAKAADMSEASSFINTWDKGLEQVIGKQFKGGIDPSKGQQQRLALSRSLYRNPRVLVLDEPTSAVDAEAETKIFETLEALPRDHTLILISHRFSTVRSADRIYVIKDGDVAEQGTHEELVAKEGMYADLFHKQAKGYR